MKILFLTPYPFNEAPSQRFRFEQYFLLLPKNNYAFGIQSFFPAIKWKLFYKNGNLIQKITLLFTGLLKRLLVLFSLGKFDFIFIHREVTPIGPPIFEWVIVKLFRKKIIYDFDDAIWLTDKRNESKIEKLLRWRGKVASICKWSYKVSCGNEYLANYARQFNSNVLINPTTIDTETLHNPLKTTKKNPNKITIGWTGSHSTLKYLKAIELVLQYLEGKYPNVLILVIADKKSDLELQNLEFLKWNKETEAEDLSKIDIGIMPLPDDEWSKGKCGFKALQYMAMGIPVIASAVGVNSAILDPGVNGFLAATPEDWIVYLSRLIEDPALCKKMGEAGRIKVIAHYSVSSNTPNFLSLFS